jgi:DNA segregation ATPase FtsK/SpoIIIE, S-DNA-T family
MAKMAKEIKIAIGETANGADYVLNLNKAPHILVGGTTGSGKSVLLHTIISQIIETLPFQAVELYLGDPKLVEFAMYERSAQVCGIANTVAEHDQMLTEIIDMMEGRFKYMKDNGYKTLIDKILCPNVVVVIDEFGDLVLDKKYGQQITEKIVKIVQLGRAAAITVILATQHPTTQVVDTRIKANCPTRIALKVSSAVNSRVVIDRMGAEKLKGRGHMLVMSPEASELEEVQGFYFTDKEIMHKLYLGSCLFGCKLFEGEDIMTAKLPWRC